MFNSFIHLTQKVLVLSLKATKKIAWGGTNEMSVIPGKVTVRPRHGRREIVWYPSRSYIRFAHSPQAIKFVACDD